MTAQAQVQVLVHLLDPETRRPLCGSPVPFAWHWTQAPGKVTCRRCQAVLAGEEARAVAVDSPDSP